ncbi:MAG: hypothetical protein QME66_13040 [Candidatus Eisenbacteria bacterium]|nr:hypothetical protein [Candidatus Eisenbacteria bacterium]
MQQIRGKLTGLSASERAGLEHDVILSLDDADDFDLDAEEDQEIRRRVPKEH